MSEMNKIEWVSFTIVTASFSTTLIQQILGSISVHHLWQAAGNTSSSRVAHNTTTTAIVQVNLR